MSYIGNDLATDQVFLPDGVGAVSRTIPSKLKDVVSVKDFGAVGNGVADDTAAIQAAIDASVGKRLHIPKGQYKITGTLSLDYTKSYWIFGDGYAITSATGTSLNSTANSPVISINNPGSGSANPDIRIEHLGILGNNAGSSQKGIYVRYTNLIIDSIYIANCSHGIHLERCFSSVISNSFIAQNYLHGLWLDKQANQVLLSHSAFNGNSRTAGYAGINIVGAASAENLAVTLVSCDVEGNGVVPASGYGIVCQHSHGVTLQGHYSEQNKSGGLYADNTVKNLSIEGSYFQDELIDIVGVDCIRYVNNRHFYNAQTTTVQIGAADGSPVLVSNNSYGPSVTTNYTSGAFQRVEHINTAAPASGTWRQGDVVWHRTPSASGNIGWVCVTAGTPGTWKTFGTISA